VTKEALLANKTLLTAVLTYHVLGSKVESTQIPLGAAITTVQGATLRIEAAGMGLVHHRCTRPYSQYRDCKYSSKPWRGSRD